MHDFLSVASIPMAPMGLSTSPLDPFGLSSAPSFGSSPFRTFAPEPPTPWNSSPPSSSASPFAYRSAAASAAAPAAAASPFGSFSFSGPSFDGLLSGHDDDLLESSSLFQPLSSPTFSGIPPPPPPRRGRGSGGTTTRTRHFNYTTRDADRSRLYFRGAAPSGRSSNNRYPVAAAAAGRSRETALEIHDSDDDEVVEVIDLVS